MRTHQNKRLVFTIIPACLFLLLSLIPKASAQTEVGGSITTDNIWTTAGSPYIVKNSIIIKAGVTLTIEPGVRVQFQAGGGLGIRVQGQIIAKGNASSPIYFESTGNIPGDWNNIMFDAGSNGAVYDTRGNYQSGSIFEYCVIQHAGANNTPGAIECQKDAVPYINHCEIKDNKTAGVYIKTDNILTLIKIENTTFSSNNGGVYISAPTVTLRGDIFKLNKAVSGIISIEANKAEITYCTFEGNEISRADVGNINLSYRGSDNLLFQITKCIFLDSKGFEIYNHSDFGTPVVDATDNWWGTTNKAKIMDRINDFFDDSSRGIVVFEPFLTVPIGEIPTATTSTIPTATTTSTTTSTATSTTTSTIPATTTTTASTTTSTTTSTIPATTTTTTSTATSTTSTPTSTKIRIPTVNLKMPNTNLVPGDSLIIDLEMNSGGFSSNVDFYSSLEVGTSTFYLDEKLNFVKDRVPVKTNFKPIDFKVGVFGRGSIFGVLIVPPKATGSYAWIAEIFDSKSGVSLSKSKVAFTILPIPVVNLKMPKINLVPGDSLILDVEMNSEGFSSNVDIYSSIEAGTSTFYLDEKLNFVKDRVPVLTNFKPLDFKVGVFGPGSLLGELIVPPEATGSYASTVEIFDSESGRILSKSKLAFTISPSVSIPVTAASTSTTSTTSTTTIMPTTTSTTSTTTIMPTTTSTTTIPNQPPTASISFARDIKPIFDGNCAIPGCHSGPNPAMGQNLAIPFDPSAGAVGVASREVPTMLRIKPGDPDNSYLVHKIQGTQAQVGGRGERMPLTGPPFLTDKQIQTIREWIRQGALDN